MNRGRQRAQRVGQRVGQRVAGWVDPCRIRVERDGVPDRVAAWPRSCSARAVTRRTQPRIVSAGTSRSPAIPRMPRPDAAATRAAPMTSMPCARRGAHQAGSSTCVPRHDMQRARRGRTGTRRPPSSRTTRHRPCPHGRSRPGHDGQPNRRSARSVRICASSRYSSIAVGQLRHEASLPGPIRAAQQGIRVAACPPAAARAYRTPNNERARHPEHEPSSATTPPPAPTPFMLTLSSHTKPNSRRAHSAGVVTGNDGRDLLHGHTE